MYKDYEADRFSLKELLKDIHLDPLPSKKRERERKKGRGEEGEGREKENNDEYTH
jgi:hypothetical protein